MWRIVNNWVHDTCTGLWIASLIVLATLHSQLPGMPEAAASAIAAVQLRILWLLVAALVGLSLTGVLRLLYWRSQARAEEVERKRRALVWKHVAYLIVFGAGSLWAFSLVWGGA